MSNGQVGRSAQLLKERGISDTLLPEFSSLSEQQVQTIVERFDADEQASIGALVFRLRQTVQKRSRPALSRRDLMAREAQYGRDIAGWLEQHVPEVCRPVWGPHPAAVAAVIRLHHVHGRTLKKAHISEIRASVAAWEARYGDDVEQAA